MIETIFDILLRYLYNEHVEYAVDLSVAGRFLFFLFCLLLHKFYFIHLSFLFQHYINSPPLILGISLAEPKSSPPNYFFSVIRQAAAITHLFEKQYDDSIYPLIE